MDKVSDVDYVRVFFKGTFKGIALIFLYLGTLVASQKTMETNLGALILFLVAVIIWTIPNKLDEVQVK